MANLTSSSASSASAYDASARDSRLTFRAG